MPLEAIHKDAPAAHAASVAAQRQGKFWEYHDKLFADYRNLKEPTLRQYAEDLGLDMGQFDRDRADAKSKALVDTDIAEARGMDVRGTPAFFINGRYLRGAQPFAGFAKLINAELERLNLPIPDPPEEGQGS